MSWWVGSNGTSELSAGCPHSLPQPGVSFLCLRGTLFKCSVRFWGQKVCTHGNRDQTDLTNGHCQNSSCHVQFNTDFPANILGISKGLNGDLAACVTSSLSVLSQKNKFYSYSSLNLVHRIKPILESINWFRLAVNLNICLVALSISGFV